MTPTTDNAISITALKAGRISLSTKIICTSCCTGIEAFARPERKNKIVPTTANKAAPVPSILALAITNINGAQMIVLIAIVIIEPNFLAK